MKIWHFARHNARFIIAYLLTPEPTLLAKISRMPASDKNVAAAGRFMRVVIAAFKLVEAA